MHSPAHSLPQFSPASSTSLDAPIAPPKEPRYLIRTDVFLSLETNTITAMLEIPGVPVSSIKISFGRDPQTKEQQLIIRGRSFPLLPDGSPVDAEKKREMQAKGRGAFLWCERKCGEFKRVMVVPAGTTVSLIPLRRETQTLLRFLQQSDIKMSMVNGILFLRYPAQPKSLASNAQLQPESGQQPSPSSSGTTSGA